MIPTMQDVTEAYGRKWKGSTMTDEFDKSEQWQRIQDGLAGIPPEALDGLEMAIYWLRHEDRPQIRKDLAVTQRALEIVCEDIRAMLYIKERESPIALVTKRTKVELLKSYLSQARAEQEDDSR